MFQSEPLSSLARPELLFTVLGLVVLALLLVVLIEIICLLCALIADMHGGSRQRRTRHA
jgi:hypothetical protein